MFVQRDAEDLQEFKKSRGQNKLRITLVNGSSIGIVQRVIGQDIGMHDVILGVEHRSGSDELQDGKIILARRVFW